MSNQGEPICVRVNIDHGEGLVEFVGHHAFLAQPRIGEQVYIVCKHETFHAKVEAVLHFGKLQNAAFGELKPATEAEVIITCIKMADNVTN